MLRGAEGSRMMHEFRVGEPGPLLEQQQQHQQTDLGQPSHQQVQEPSSSVASSICVNLAKWALEHDCSSATLYDQTDPSMARHLGNSSVPLLHAASPMSAYNHHHHHHHHHNHQHHHHHTSNLITHLDPAAAGSPLTKVVTDHLLGPCQFIESKLDYYSSDIWLATGDERTNKLPFVGAGPWKLIYATLIYLLLIKWLLPRIMRPLRPLELNWPIRLYNLSMVLSNMWAFYHGARILEFGTKCFGCETINHQDYSEQAIELLHYGWLFFLSRLVEWLDTIFFVLRKKERQVTKLHVFHHSFVPLISWTYLKYHPGYTMAFFPLVNSLVHSIMYTYYLLATFGPKVQPYLWWKRYLTSLQIVQFILIIIQLASIPLTSDDSCQYPRGFLYVAFAGAILFLWLFFTYYIDTYSKRQQMSTGNSGASKQQRRQWLPSSDRQSGCGGAALSDPSRRSNQREGSSRALSDAIDNAIGCCDQAELAQSFKSSLDAASTRRLKRVD